MAEEGKDENKNAIEQRDSKEDRIRALTSMYYANPKIKDVLLEFAKDREVVPRYYEGFGKRPDSIQYSSDIDGLVRKGATSFHASEELWIDPLGINSDMSPDELNEKRKGWDLLIDIDSPFIDCSKIAAKLIIAALENKGIKNYGIKFSGSKGFHIIVSGKAFPKEYDGKHMKDMFPEWPRAISEFLMDYIRVEYNKQAAAVLTNFEAIERRTNVSKEELSEEVYCKMCEKPAKKGAVHTFVCDTCGLEIKSRDNKITKRELRCTNASCPGHRELVNTEEYFYCEDDKDPENEKFPLSSDKYPQYFEKVVGVSAAKVAALDLVLVAPRHLFRMPYSLHEKTALASVVLKKEEIDNFSPKDANPLNVQIRKFLPENTEEEARNLLVDALDWKKTRTDKEEVTIKKKYASYDNNVDSSKINESMFPAPIKKLLLGLNDGKKRGLFILITFLRSLNFPADYINKTVRDWNEKNTPPLKEGYIRSQVDWHVRQKKKILPPNYDNPSFYKDLGLLDGKQTTKNPVVDVSRKLRGR